MKPITWRKPESYIQRVIFLKALSSTKAHSSWKPIDLRAQAPEPESHLQFCLISLWNMLKQKSATMISIVYCCDFTTYARVHTCHTRSVGNGWKKHVSISPVELNKDIQHAVLVSLTEDYCKWRYCLCILHVGTTTIHSFVNNAISRNCKYDTYFY